jgi:hypothetical protein
LNRLNSTALVLLSTGLLASAGQSVGNASSSAAFELHGSLVNVAGVPTWPLLAGDQVVARESSVSIAMRDGSRITLSPDSRLQIESSGKGLSVNLLTGSMRYTVSGSLEVLNNRVPVVGKSGVVGLNAAVIVLPGPPGGPPQHFPPPPGPRPPPIFPPPPPPIQPPGPPHISPL